MDENDPGRPAAPPPDPQQPTVPPPPPPQPYASTNLQIGGQTQRLPIFVWVVVAVVVVVAGCVMLALLYNVLVIQPQQREMDDVFSRIGSALGP